MFFVNFGYAQDDYNLKIAQSDIVTPTDASSLCSNNATPTLTFRVFNLESSPSGTNTVVNVDNKLGPLTSIPFLKKADNPHVINLSPPLNMETRWFQNHVGYTMAKFGMSMCVLGMHSEYKRFGIAFNALWPRTAIATAAVANHLGGEAMMAKSRTPEIMADAAYVIMNKDSTQFTGNFCIDDEVLSSEGITDFIKYQVDPNLDPGDLVPDFFI